MCCDSGNNYFIIIFYCLLHNSNISFCLNVLIMKRSPNLCGNIWRTKEKVIIFHCEVSSKISPLHLNYHHKPVN